MCNEIWADQIQDLEVGVHPQFLFTPIHTPRPSLALGGAQQVLPLPWAAQTRQVQLNPEVGRGAVGGKRNWSSHASAPEAAWLTSLPTSKHRKPGDIS